jgi:hypothetical protein
MRTAKAVKIPREVLDADPDLEARVAAARLGRDKTELSVLEDLVLSRDWSPPGDPVDYDDTIPDELLVVDAAGRLGGKGTRAKCPLCDEGFIAGKGHLGSDFCLVKRTVLRQKAEGFVRVDHWQWSQRGKGLLEVAGVEVRWLPGHLERGIVGAFRGVEAKDAPFAPRWALRVLRATRGWKRDRRIALLEVLLEPAFAEVLAFVATSRNVPRGLLFAATRTKAGTRQALRRRWKEGERSPVRLIKPKGADANG